MRSGVKHYGLECFLFLLRDSTGGFRVSTSSRNQLPRGSGPDFVN